MPRGRRELPAAFTNVLRCVERIIHAGDFVERSVLEALESYCPVTAVHGNVDSHELQLLLPATTTLEIDGVTIGAIHDAGPAKGRLERMRARFPDADAVIFAHSHLPLHERRPDGFQIFNPGSPTERRRAPAPTIGIARCRDGRVTFDLIDVG